MDLVVRTERIPRPGETVVGRDFVTIPGGKGANQAAAAARLGVRVDMVGRVGNDAFGPALLDNMRRQGVGISHVTLDPDAASGIAMIMIDACGENSIVVAAGANGRVSRSDLEGARELLAQARYLLMQFEIPLEVVREAISLANELGVRVILNPAPAHAVDADLMRGVYCLVANETETEALTGVAVREEGELQLAAKRLLGLGIPVVIVTLGARGAFLASDGLRLLVPARQVQVVDTTAAGDAFVGGLVAAFLQGRDLPQAVRYATCAGTLATTKLGAQTSLPSAAEVEAFFNEGLD
ncbi:MAG: ribokinase [Chloroflexi bacterium]|nr:ribokinase [Chloroflexota bacterium]